MTNENVACAAGTKPGVVTYRPAMDLHEFPDRYEIKLDVPGASPEGLDVTVADGVLTVEAHVRDRAPAEDADPLLAEYGVGDFRRSVRLGEDVDADVLTATLSEGVLTLTLPKRSERLPRRIDVTRG